MEIKFMIGSPVKECPPVLGSVLVNCFDCDCQMWMSQASLNLMLERESKPICMPCANKRTPGQVVVVPPSEEQLDEMVRELKRETGLTFPKDVLRKITHTILKQQIEEKLEGEQK